MSESTVTIHDVARHAGVSAATVSNFFNWPDKLSDRMRERVEASVNELGFVPSMPARQLRRGHSGIVGLSVVNASNPFFSGIATAVEQVAEEADLQVVVGSSHESAERQEKFLTLFEQLRFDGVLVGPTDEELEPLRRRRDRGTPVVLIDHEDPDGRLSSVSLDHRAGGRLAAEHLVASGYKRLLFAAGPEGVRQVARRLEGCREVVSGVADVHLEVARSGDLDLTLGQDLGRWIAALDPDERPDAVFAGNDLHAIGLVNALVEAGLRVPDDVAVVGYDDIPFAQMAAVPLTTIRQPIAEIGRAAARLLLDEIAERGRPARDVVFPPELVVRASAP